jgi:hypothetical protein
MDKRYGEFAKNKKKKVDAFSEFIGCLNSRCLNSTQFSLGYADFGFSFNWTSSFSFNWILEFLSIGRWFFLSNGRGFFFQMDEGFG